MTTEEGDQMKGLARVVSGDVLPDLEADDRPLIASNDELAPSQSNSVSPVLIENDGNDDQNLMISVTMQNQSEEAGDGSSLSSDGDYNSSGVKIDHPSHGPSLTTGPPIFTVDQSQQARFVGNRSESKGLSSVPTGLSDIRTSKSNSGNWGWFEDPDQKKKKKKTQGMFQYLIDDSMSVESLFNVVDPPEENGAMEITAPNYVLEESMSSQKLWKLSAGNRPPQPAEERAFYEKMWAQNFARSQVDYRVPVEVLTATTQIHLSPFADEIFGDGHATTSGGDSSLEAAAFVSRMNKPDDGRYGSNTDELQPRHMIVNKKIKGSSSDEDLTVLARGDNVFGTTVSKSFPCASERAHNAGVETVNISIASYRVVESRKAGKYAQFLVIYREGSIRDTLGVWKRYSDFEDLSSKVTQAHDGCSNVLANISPLTVTEDREQDVEHLPNAITSWRLLKKRKRWYRCLDSGYLSLKVFLLERFLHDILFESSSPKLLRDFIGSVAERSSVEH